VYDSPATSVIRSASFRRLDSLVNAIFVLPLSRALFQTRLRPKKADLHRPAQNPFLYTTKFCARSNISLKSAETMDNSASGIPAIRMFRRHL
jgi:hypothetical protein